MTMLAARLDFMYYVLFIQHCFISRPSCPLYRTVLGLNPGLLPLWYRQ
jgi:hypothetical protein